MTEEQLLARIQRLVPAWRPTSLVLGIGDDAAIYRPKPGHDLVFTTDMMHEGRHFLRDFPPHAIGWKALARGLSDIAAMGAQPAFALLSLALADWVSPRWVDSFFRGLLSLAAEHKVPLAGGDLARAAHVSLDIVVCGAVPRGKAFRRDGAQPGDQIVVSGELGGAVLGLHQPRNRAARQRLLTPQPRLALARALSRRLVPTAAMDLSDGLSTDLARLCRASGVSARLHTAPPRFPGATEADTLHGGDDYELLFTVPASARVPAQLAKMPLTVIGAIEAGRPGQITYNGKRLRPQGWDHFARG